MVKRRIKDSEVQAFTDAADRPATEMDEDAPRGRKRGGTDVLLPLNQYEKKMVAAAAKRSRRSVASFIRNATLDAAIRVLDEPSASTPVDTNLKNKENTNDYLTGKPERRLR